MFGAFLFAAHLGKVLDPCPPVSSLSAGVLCTPWRGEWAPMLTGNRAPASRLVVLTSLCAIGPRQLSDGVSDARFP